MYRALQLNKKRYSSSASGRMCFFSGSQDALLTRDVIVLSSASSTVPWFYLCPIISPAVASFWILCWGPNSMSQNTPTWKWLTRESLWPGHEPGGMKGVYCELDEKYINKGILHCSIYHITIRSKTIYTDLEPRGQLSLIQWKLCMQTKGSLSFFCPQLITGFWHFFGLSHTNNGRSTWWRYC